jgi:thymidylate kinase
MASVALIGPDGAGKTTLTRMLEDSGLLRFRYLYMGIQTSSSNIALPTSRLLDRLRARRQKATSSPRSGGDHRRSGVSVRGLARLANWLAEEWFRQAVSWCFQARGYIALYDRHFVFDFAPEVAAKPSDSLEKRVHRWCLTHLYPRPDLVIFLDVPGTVLFARKGESTVEELESRRQGFLRIGERIPGFVRVDATRPLPEVYADVSRCVGAFFQTGYEQRLTTRGTWS